MNFLYMGMILLSAFGMVMIDKQYRLAFWCDYRRTVLVLVLGVMVFSLWDIIGISLGIFFSGHSDYMSGIYLAPDFPVEEVLFLLFLCYFTLIVYRLLEVKWQHI